MVDHHGQGIQAHANRAGLFSGIHVPTIHQLYSTTMRTRLPPLWTFLALCGASLWSAWTRSGDLFFRGLSLTIVMTSNEHAPAASLARLAPEEQPSSSSTLIVAFADANYRELALKWYHRLEEVGYTNHTVVAIDRGTESYLSERGYRVDHIGGSDCPLELYQHRTLRYRKRIYASRWAYVRRQLLKGRNVLLTDADCVVNRHLPMSELESSDYDIYHAMDGTVPAYPKDVYYRWSFTVNGGMVWLRAKPSVIKFIEMLLERCNCLLNQTCACDCDDQVMINRLHVANKVIWDRTPFKPATAEEYPWEGFEGRCNATGNRIAVWDRHTAYRGFLPSNASRCPNNNWMSMPYLPPKYERIHLPELWRQACGDGRGGGSRPPPPGMDGAAGSSSNLASLPSEQQ